MSRVMAVDGFGEVAQERETFGLEQKLREDFNSHMSSDILAELIQRHPQQAKNEIRSVCSQIFTESSWGLCSEAQKESLVERLIDVVFGLGVIQPLVDDPQVSEIMVNSTESIYYEEDGRLHKSSLIFSTEDQIRSMIDRIVSPIGRRIDEESPMVDARLPQGYRVNVVIPPIAVDGPVVTIRKFNRDEFTLDDMVSQGCMSSEVKTFLGWTIRARKNVIVSGGTGSGKTTLLNALSQEISPCERIVTIEDSAELRFDSHPHVVRLEARPCNTEGVGEISIRDLVANSLRMRPDRIIVGECRGSEALDMLQAMNTGHEGSLTTLHANSPADMVTRLATMVRFGVDLPIDVVELNIASAVDVVVQIARALTGERYIQEIAGLRYEKGDRACEAVTYYSRPSVVDKGVWIDEPQWIDEVCKKGDIFQKEVLAWQEKCFF